MLPAGLIEMNHRWLGLRGDVLEPAAMLLAVERSSRADTCNGCLFRHPESRECREACSMAVRAGCSTVTRPPIQTSVSSTLRRRMILRQLELLDK